MGHRQNDGHRGELIEHDLKNRERRGIEVRKGGGIIKALWAGIALTLIGLSTTAPALAERREKLLRTPRTGWLRSNDLDAQRVTLISTSRAVAIEMRIGSNLPDETDVKRLVERLSGQSVYKVKGRWPKTVLEQAEVQMGISFSLADGRKGFYAAIWRKRTDGQLGITGYMTIATEYSEENIADFKRVRSYGNQLARGSVLFASEAPLVEPATVPSTVPSTVIAASQPVIAPAATPVPAMAAATKAPVGTTQPVLVPVAPAPVLSPVPSASAVPAATSAAAAVPAVAAAASIVANEKGVSLSEVASLLYAPLESSEVFVLFKDGSFHENLPVALEQWNLSTSRSTDPASWGKWKPSKDDGDFELKYAEDDIVTISAKRVKPAKNGMQLDGAYGLENEQGDITGEVRFTGNRFDLTGKGGKQSGTYRITGYSIILTHDSGLEEHRPFFIVPPEDEEEEPSIWFGSNVYIALE
jgi:hypothetical protein